MILFASSGITSLSRLKRVITHTLDYRVLSWNYTRLEFNSVYYRLNQCQSYDNIVMLVTNGSGLYRTGAKENQLELLENNTRHGLLIYWLNEYDWQLLVFINGIAITPSLYEFSIDGYNSIQLDRIRTQVLLYLRKITCLYDLKWLPTLNITAFLIWLSQIFFKQDLFNFTAS